MHLCFLKLECVTQVPQHYVNWHVYVPRVDRDGKILSIRIFDFFNPRNNPKTKWAPLLLSPPAFDTLIGKVECRMYLVGPFYDIILWLQRSILIAKL